MEAWLIHLVTTQPYLVYAIIIVLACAEGPILSMIGGVLIKLGYFHFIPLYAALMLGDVLGDSAWYWVGRRYGLRFVRRFGKYVNVDEASIAKLERVFHHYKHRILFLSKISNGLGFSLVTLITAGMVRIPFSRYLVVNLVGQFVWSGALIGVGYFFSQSYMLFNNWLERVFLCILFIILIVAFTRFTKYMRNRLSKVDNADEIIK